MCMLMDFTYVVLSHQIKQIAFSLFQRKAIYCMRSNVQKKRDLYFFYFFYRFPFFLLLYFLSTLTTNHFSRNLHTDAYTTAAVTYRTSQ